MKEVTDFSFKDTQGKYIAVIKYGATWVNNTNKHNISFNKKSLKLAINYLLDQFFSMLAIKNFVRLSAFDPAPSISFCV